LINNDILNGEDALSFLSTPYGLVAFGKASVGLVATE
jgi:hypothetical protein